DNRVNIIVIPKEGKIHPQDISLGQGDNPFDLIVAVDTADISLFGSVYTDAIDMFSSVPILNIDHHISNTGYGQLQLIDPTAASATEVLYHWFNQIPEWKSLISADMATLLLTGLITDTRSFQNPNTTPRSLEVAAELLELGARQQEIIKNIYKTKPLSTLKIWGRALNKIQIDPQARIVWSTISKEDLAEMEATSKETHGILDELISTIPDADIHVLFTELEDGKGLKASTRSNAKIDVSELVGELFGGGGHPRAAGFRVQKFDNFDLAVLECVSKLKGGLEKRNNEVNEIPVRGEKQIRNEKNEPKETKSQPLVQSSPQDSAEQASGAEEAKDKGIDVLSALEKSKDKGSEMDVVEEIDGK
ncbi:MAG: hypothetical protein KAS32_11255, partial [Candidatus Peribacteraceae bacterium]|nr:hypothetical protein [Candidatus Peribacteraceae bacterium]